MRNDRLRISEHFYSIQGEGKTMGIPSVFIRLQMHVIFYVKENGFVIQLKFGKKER